MFLSSACGTGRSVIKKLDTINFFAYLVKKQEEMPWLTVFCASYCRFSHY